MISFEKLRRLLMCADQLVSAPISHTDGNSLEATVGLSLVGAYWHRSIVLRVVLYGHRFPSAGLHAAKARASVAKNAMKESRQDSESRTERC